MKKTIAAWTIATAVVLGLAACTGSPSSNTGASTGSSAEQTPAETPAEDAPSSGQSVADGCGVVQSKIQSAAAAVSGMDMSQAMEDPQGTLDTLTETADTVGKAVDSVSNNEVKTAVSAVYDDLIALRDLASAVLIDGDVTAAAGLSSAVTDAQTSAQELATLCS